MKNKWLRYYKYIPKIYLIVVFHPSCKFDNLIECFENYYELLGLGDDENVDVAIIINKVSHLCNKLCEVYAIQTSTSGEISSIILHSSSSQQYVKYDHQFLHERRKKSRSSSHSELDTYLTIVFEFGDEANFQILEWWKMHKATFSTLATSAK